MQYIHLIIICSCLFWTHDSHFALAQNSESSFGADISDANIPSRDESDNSGDAMDVNDVGGSRGSGDGSDGGGGGGGGDSTNAAENGEFSDNTINVIINDETTISIPFRVDGYSITQKPIDLIDIARARIINGPPGLGCYFRTSQNRSPFISDLFFSPRTVELKLATMRTIDLLTDFKFTTSIHCFLLQSAEEASSRLGLGLDSINPDSGQTEHHTFITPLRRLRNIRHVASFLKTHFARHEFQPHLTLLRASMIFTPIRSMICEFAGRRSLRRVKEITVPLPQVDDLFCFTREWLSVARDALDSRDPTGTSFLNEYIERDRYLNPVRVDRYVVAVFSITHAYIVSLLGY